MSKLMRRAELQDKYGWEKHPNPLPWKTVRRVTVKISDYARQETILEWIVDNKDIYDYIYPPTVWQRFLDNVEKTPDTPIEELLDTFKGDYKILCEIETLTMDIAMMQLVAKDFLNDPWINASAECPKSRMLIQPLIGWYEYAKLYAEKETRLAELRETHADY